MRCAGIPSRERRGHEEEEEAWGRGETEERRVVVAVASRSPAARGDDAHLRLRTPRTPAMTRRRRRCLCWCASSTSGSASETSWCRSAPSAQRRLPSHPPKQLSVTAAAAFFTRRLSHMRRPLTTGRVRRMKHVRVNCVTHLSLYVKRQVERIRDASCNEWTSKRETPPAVSP